MEAKMEERGATHEQGGSLPLWFHRRLQKAGIDRMELFNQQWADHPGRYKFSYEAEPAFVTSPYTIGQDDIDQINAFCEKIDATWSIRGNSPYGYGTVLVGIVPRRA
jgi:hypothetical protein